MRYAYVKSIMERLLREGILHREDSVLAICAGPSEWKLFTELQIPHVTCSNLDDRLKGDEFEPFAYLSQDSQQLISPDESFDFVFVSDGLHHCSSPHRALLEMYRVARKGIIVFESRDSFLMRLANRLHLAPQYELEEVVVQNFTHGGVNNTSTPNFVYRWTEREFIKTISAHNPACRHVFRFFYGLNLPYGIAELKKSPLKKFLLMAAEPLIRLFTMVFKKQCNSFTMMALKPRLPEDLWPWMEMQEGRPTLRREYARERFKAPPRG